MEKFNRWSDPASGINPFVPISRKNHGTLVSRVITFLLGMVLVFIRVPLLLMVGSPYILLSVLVGTIPVPVVQRPLTRLVDWVFAGLILYIVGVWSVPAKYADLKSLRLRRSTEKGSSRPLPVGSGVKSGDILLCNATSYIEVIYLTFRFSPVFAGVVTSDGRFESAGVIPQTFWSALARAVSAIPMPVSTEKTSLKRMSDAISGSKFGPPIVCFAEGIKTNGGGILKFPPIFDGLHFEANRVHLVGLKFPASSPVSLSNPVGSSVNHLFWSCFYMSHSMSLVMLPAQELVAPPEQDNMTGELTDAEHRAHLAERATSGAYGGGVLPNRTLPPIGIFGDRARSLLASMLRVKALGRCALDFEDFLDFWMKRDSGEKKKR